MGGMMENLTKIPKLVSFIHDLSIIFFFAMILITLGNVSVILLLRVKSWC